MFSGLNLEHVVIIVFCIVVIFILGKLAFPIVKSVIIGLIPSTLISIALVSFFGISTDTAVLIGIIIFVLTITFGRTKGFKPKIVKC